jgi:hypothetical protein
MNSVTTPTLPDSNPQTGGNRDKRDWKSRFLQFRFPAILVGVLTIGFLFLAYLQFTLVTGVELNKRNWNLREFSFHRDPFTNFQFRGIIYGAPKQFNPWSANPVALQADLDPQIAKYLQAGSETGQSPNIPSSAREDWDLVDLRSRSPHGDARILVDILRANDSRLDPFWPIWSKNNPTKAAIFWPAARDLVHCSLYQSLPELFELALVQTSDAQFKRLITKAAGRSLREFELRLRARGELERADSVQAIAATYSD